MIINRYLLQEFIKPMVVSLGVLSVRFTSYGAAELLVPVKTDSGSERVCAPRQRSNILIWCTQLSVQVGLQSLSVLNSRLMSSRVYSSNGIPGYPRRWEHQ